MIILKGSANEPYRIGVFIASVLRKTNKAFEVGGEWVEGGRRATSETECKRGFMRGG